MWLADLPFDLFYIEWLSSLAIQDTVVLTQGLVATVGDESGLLQFAQKKRLFGVLSNGSTSQIDHSAEQFATLSLSQVKDIQIEFGDEIIKPDNNTKSSKKQSR